MGSPSIPNPWTFNIHTDDDLLSDIHIKELPLIKLEAKTDSKLEAKTDSKIDAKTDSVIRIKELPQIDLQFGMRPTRIHLPMNMKFGLCLLGVQLLCFDICGENMLVIEDYKAHGTEKCD